MTAMRQARRRLKFFGETVLKHTYEYCMSVNVILSTSQGQAQVTKGHYNQVSFGSCDTCFRAILALEFDGYVSSIV